MPEWATKSARRAAQAKLGCGGCPHTLRKALRNGTGGWCNFPGGKVEVGRNGKCKMKGKAA